jgi:hypothetical protein
VTPPANSATWQPFPAEAGGENGASWTGTEHNAAIHNGTTFLAPTTVGVRTNMPNATGVMTYAAWSQLAVEDQVGPFWVVDPAGWAYWMLPVPAQTSTGLLLDQIELRTDTVGNNTLIASDANPEIDWWYGIHVTAEMALADNWNLWDTEGAGMTPEGVRIMQRATEPAPPDFVVDVDVDNEGNVTVTVTPDDNYDVSVDNGNIIVTLPDAEPGDDIQVNLPPGGGWTSTPGTDGDGNVIITITPPPGYEVVEQPPGSGNIVLRPTTVFFTVIFDPNGGQPPVPDPQEVAQGALATNPGAMERVNHIFLGWFLGDAAEPFNFATTPITADIILVARWQIDNVLPTHPGDGPGGSFDPEIDVNNPWNGRSGIFHFTFPGAVVGVPDDTTLPVVNRDQPYRAGSFPLADIISEGPLTGITVTATNPRHAQFVSIGENDHGELSVLFEPFITFDQAIEMGMAGDIFLEWTFPLEVTLTRGTQSATVTLNASFWGSLVT